MLQEAQIVIDQLTADWEKLKGNKKASQKLIDFKMRQINVLIDLYNIAEQSKETARIRKQISIQSNMIAMFALELLRASKYDVRVITDLLNRGNWETSYNKAVEDVKLKLWSASELRLVSQKVNSRELPVHRFIDFLQWEKVQEFELEKESRAMILEIIKVINNSIENGVEKAN